MSQGMEDNDFDFSEFIDEPMIQPAFPSKEPVLPSGESETPPETEKPSNPYDTEVQTSYLLVNALLTLLQQKGIIQPHEVQPIISELHKQYMAKKGRGL
jgi:hypothetical protein